MKTSLQVLIDPSLDEAAEAVKDGLAKRRVLLIIGNCWVDYRGRASSKLEPGERIVLIKDDGALLVHRPEGYEPVNWMPGGGVRYQVNKLGELSVNWQTTDF